MLKTIDDLRAADYNPRKISKDSEAGLRASIENFGDIAGITFNETTGRLVCGHQRVSQIRALGGQLFHDEVGAPYLAIGKDKKKFPVRLVQWSEAQEKAANVTANNHHIGGDFSDGLQPLLDEIEASIGEDDFLDLRLDQLAVSLPGDDEIGEDAAVEEPEEPISKHGDVWVMGDHRLMCGDSTDAAQVARLLDGKIPEIMVTDPPFGISYTPEKRSWNKNKKKMGKVLNDDRADWYDAWALFPGDVAYVYHAETYSAVVLDSLERVNFRLRNRIIWVKDRLALSRGDYHYRHEPCLYLVREGKKSQRNADRTQTTVWEIPAREDDGHGHSTQKPLECMARPIRNHTFDMVYEPFSGSGTTILAAEHLGKKCFAMELNPPYVDIAIKRWEDKTGLKAELEK